MNPVTGTRGSRTAGAGPGSPAPGLTSAVVVFEAAIVDPIAAIALERELAGRAAVEVIDVALLTS